MNFSDGESILKSREENIAPTSGTLEGPTSWQQKPNWRMWNPTGDAWDCILLTRYYKTFIRQVWYPASILQQYPSGCKGAVLKTARPARCEGSNPSCCAMSKCDLTLRYILKKLYPNSLLSPFFFFFFCRYGDAKPMQAVRRWTDLNALIAQRWSSRLLTVWFKVRILVRALSCWKTDWRS